MIWKCAKDRKKLLQGWVMQPMYSLSDGGLPVLYLKICKDPLGSEWCKFYQKSINARLCLYTCQFFVSLQRHYTITRQIYMYPFLISLLQIAKLSQEWLLYLWCLQLSVWPCAQLNVIPQHFTFTLDWTFSSAPFKITKWLQLCSLPLFTHSFFHHKFTEKSSETMC